MDSLTSPKQIFSFFKDQIISIYSTEEAESLSFIILKDILGISRFDIISDKTVDLIPDGLWNICLSILDRLKQNEPIQYILGETEFLGCRIKVNPSVLIPRPETEELIDFIIKDNINKEDLFILDICTGSGCIPIALSKCLHSSKCFALDISKAALSTAKENSALNNTDIEFSECDIINNDIPWNDVAFNIIISNPPYVRMSEKKEMQRNVLDYEPAIALFVEDSNPLIFYRRIIQQAACRLCQKGKLYFEINEHFGQEVSQLMKEMNFTDIKVMKDLFGKDRFVTGRLE